MNRLLKNPVKFEKDFADFEQNRMYPPGYGKEAAVKRITLKHIDSISHAETFIFGGVTQTTEARLRREIEADLERLADVKRFLLRTLYEPGLPITTEIPEKAGPSGNADQRD